MTVIEYGRWRIAPRIDGASGVWYHGTRVRTFRATRDRAFAVAVRFARLYGVTVRVYVDRILPCGAVSSERHECAWEIEGV